MRHIRDFEQAFKDAEGNGFFEGRDIRDYMYMYSDGINDIFKSYLSRKSIRTDYEEVIS